MVGERPRLAVSASTVRDMRPLSSWRWRGTRMVHALSRKWRLISPTTFGMA